MNVTEYVGLAMKKQGWTTRTAVSDALGVDKSLLSHWSYGKVPGWKTTQALARLAGITEQEALIDWAEWQSKGSASTTAAKIKRALKLGTAAALAFVFAGTHGQGVGIQRANAASPQVIENYTLCDKRSRRWKTLWRDTQRLLKDFFTLGPTPLPGVLA